MKPIRIRGLVAAANHTRRALSGSISRSCLGDLRRRVSETIRQIDRILAHHGGTWRDLAGPARAAYRYLKDLDFRAVATEEPEHHRAEASPLVKFPGLRSHLTKLLDELTTATPSDLDRIQGVIRGSNENIENVLARDGVQPQQLTAETRATRGWLAYFADPANLADYGAAVRRANQAFEGVCAASRSFPLPARTHFRPLAGMFRIRAQKTRTLVCLPTPMICFDENLLTKLASMALRRKSDRQAIWEAMESEAFQSIRAEIESLGGVVERTAGAHHDLARAFQRVNESHFNGVLPRPRLAWSDAFGRRKFGHYDFVRDTVMISSALDGAAVPEFLVDYILYHELLHKKLGARWKNGRRMVHTTEFKREERRFPRAVEAEKLLKRLARRLSENRESTAKAV